MKSMVDFRTSRFCRLKAFESLHSLVSLFWQDVGGKNTKTCKQNFEGEICWVERARESKLKQRRHYKVLRAQRHSSTWVKNEEKLLAALEKRKSKEPQKLRKANHDSVDQAAFKWFLDV